MLFDLRSGKRRRAVQIVYGFLAVSFFIGFVVFGVGSGGIGSLSDVLGLGNGNSSGSVSSQFNDQIDAANAKLAKNPKDEQALQALAKNEFYKGRAETDQDPQTGAPIVTDTAHTDLGKAVDAWERYLKLAKDPSAQTALVLVQAYLLLNDAQGAVRTQEIIAKASPTAQNYGSLAVYEYFAGDIKGGDADAKKALAKYPKDQRAQNKKTLDQYRKQAVQFLKAQKKQGKAGAAGGTSTSPLSNPFGGLGSAPPTP